MFHFQLVQSVFSTACYDTKYFHLLGYAQSLCCSISRPKAHLVANFDKWSKRVEEVLNLSRQEGTAPYTTNNLHMGFSYRTVTTNGIDCCDSLDRFGEINFFFFFEKAVNFHNFRRISEI